MVGRIESVDVTNPSSYLKVSKQERVEVAKPFSTTKDVKQENVGTDFNKDVLFQIIQRFDTTQLREALQYAKEIDSQRSGRSDANNKQSEVLNNITRKFLSILNPRGL